MIIIRFDEEKLSGFSSHDANVMPSLMPIPEPNICSVEYTAGFLHWQTTWGPLGKLAYNSLQPGSLGLMLLVNIVRWGCKPTNITGIPTSYEINPVSSSDTEGPCGTWWLIPLSKWVITPVINGISRVNPLIVGVISHLLTGKFATK